MRPRLTMIMFGTFLARIFGLALASGILLGTTPAAAQTDYRKVVDGFSIYLGIVPAEIVKGHAQPHPEATMHGGAKASRDTHHVMVSIIDDRSGKTRRHRISCLGNQAHRRSPPGPHRGSQPSHHKRGHTSTLRRMLDNASNKTKTHTAAISEVSEHAAKGTSKMKLSFLGATGTVTGSKYLIAHDGAQAMLREHAYS